jgi:hypothetical protein
MLEVLGPLMLDAKGKPVLTGDKVLPMDVLTSTIKVIIKKLGK